MRCSTLSSDRNKEEVRFAQGGEVIFFGQPIALCLAESEAAAKAAARSVVRESPFLRHVILNIIF